MEITFKPCVEDGFAFFRAIKQWPFPWKFAFLLLPFSMFIVSVSQLLNDPFIAMRINPNMAGTAPPALSFPIWKVLGSSMLLFVWCVAICWGVTWVLQRWLMQKMGLFADNVTIQENELGITVQTANTNIFLRWQSVREIIETPTHIAFVGAKQRGLIVPKRAFNLSEEAKQFVNYARAQHQKAQPETPPISKP